MRNDLFLIALGKKLRAARKAKKLTIKQLSDLTGVDASNLSYMENGVRGCRLLTLKTLADFYKKDIKHFL